MAEHTTSGERDMARSKDMSYYPEQFFDCTRKVAAQDKELTMELESRKEGERLRGQYYAFVQAGMRHVLRVEELKVLASKAKSAADAAKLPAITPLMKEQAIVAELAKKVLITLEDLPEGKVRITFTRRDNSWQAKMLDRMEERPSARGKRLEEMFRDMKPQAPGTETVPPLPESLATLLGPEPLTAGERKNMEPSPEALARTAKYGARSSRSKLEREKGGGS